MNPFIFPKHKHQRNQTPRAFVRYQTYKKYLRQEFKGACVYCMMPDSQKGWDSYGVDHYRPKEIFPEDETVYNNLFYCCNACNSFKGPYWPAKGKEKTLFIPNPCEHEMFKHLKFESGEVRHKTEPGRFTAELLDLNEPKTVEYRENMIHLISVCESKLMDLQEIEKNAKKKLNLPTVDASKLQTILSKVSIERDKTKKALKQLCGEFAVFF